MIDFEIRSAEAADADAIAAIYAPFVRETAITFEEEVPDAAEMARRIAEVRATLPWLIALEGEEVVGYAYAAPFRARPAYRWFVETTVYVSRDHPRRGIGYALYAPLMAQLEAQGYVAAIGAITLPNLASVRLHEALGFLNVGTYRKAGFKNGAWHDVGIWQRELAPRTIPPAEPLPPSDPPL